MSCDLAWSWHAAPAEGTIDDGSGARYPVLQDSFLNKSISPYSGWPNSPWYMGVSLLQAAHWRLMLTYLGLWHSYPVETFPIQSLVVGSYFRTLPMENNNP